MPSAPFSLVNPSLRQNRFVPFFAELPDRIPFEGLTSRNPLAFKRYDASKKVGDKTMAEHLRFAVCYWHTFRGTGADPFGTPTMSRPWESNSDPMQRARDTMDAAFEFMFNSNRPGTIAPVSSAPGETTLAVEG